MKILIVARAQSVRALLKRSISGLHAEVECITDLGKLDEHKDLSGPGTLDSIIMDPEGLSSVDVEIQLKRWLSQQLTIVLVLPEDSALACGESEGVLRVTRPRLPAGWEELCKRLPSLVMMRKRDKTSRPPPGLELIAIGASAGGPGAIVELLDALGGDLKRVAVVLVQHIAQSFVGEFRIWLAKKYSDIRVDLAAEGKMPVPGSLTVAPPNAHLLLDPKGIFRLDQEEIPVNGHMPSIDVFFESLCDWARLHLVAAVLLSGMGRDGASGLTRLHEAGVLTFAQDFESSIVFGMPRAAIESGAAEHAMSPEEIGSLLREKLVERP